MLEYTLIPAYGRNYRTLAAVIKAWKDGKDFSIETAVYTGRRLTSIRDLSKFPGEHVKIRYRNLERFILVRIADGTITQDDESIEDES